jgi:hypothetical protein
MGTLVERMRYTYHDLELNLGSEILGCGGDDDAFIGLGFGLLKKVRCELNLPQTTLWIYPKEVYIVLKMVYETKKWNHFFENKKLNWKYFWVWL